MEDLLAAVLGAIFECLVEALIEFGMGLAAGAISRAMRRMFVGTRRIGALQSSIIFALAGIGAGFLSVWIFPHPLVPPSRFHGASLIISPLVTGAFMAYLGRGIRRSGRQSVAIESFRYGFVFALAIAVVRFLFVTRPIH